VTMRPPFPFYSSPEKELEMAFHLLKYGGAAHPVSISNQT